MAGITLHLGMEAFMNLHLFGPVTITSLLLFLDPATAASILGSLLAPFYAYIPRILVTVATRPMATM